ncbi:MAG: SPOR domain-containing protein [Pseudomonadota bacterium]
MARITTFTFLSALALAGCDEAGQFTLGQSLGMGATAAEDGTVSRAATPGTTIERDVEAPEIFSANEAGLWDGRPSLGGVWVAHPDVQDPERVIIRNNANGKFVVGALFRRERDIPGPRLQVSSDAATELGMLAGAPVALEVTALRKETVTEAPEAPLVEAVAEPAPISETPLDPIAAAGAALDAVEPTPASLPAAAPSPAAAPAPRASTLDKPFIQIGIFSVEANANRTAQQMRSAGIVPTVKTFENGGKTFHRVIVGPATSTGERSALLDKIKEEGFSDAYAVTN